MLWTQNAKTFAGVGTKRGTERAGTIVRSFFSLRARKRLRARNFCRPSTSTPGRICGSWGVSAGFAIRFSCDGMSRARRRVLTPGWWWEQTYGVARWVSIAGERGERGRCGGNTSYTRNKTVRQRRRINAGQTSVTMYAYGLGEGCPCARLPWGETGMCKPPRNIRTYASTSTGEPSVGRIPVDWYLGPIFISSFARGEKRETKRESSRKRERGRKVKRGRERRAGKNRAKAQAGHGDLSDVVDDNRSKGYFDIP